MVPDGVEIRRTDIDWGPATKVLAAAREFQGQDVDILFGDDDRAYTPGWAASFVMARQVQPGACIANLGLEAASIAKSITPRKLQPRAQRRWRITDLEFQTKFIVQQVRAGRNWRSIAEPPRRVFKTAGYADIFEGCGGVMVRPKFFNQEFYTIPPVLWTVDDVWLSGMMAQAGVAIWINDNQYEPAHTAAEQCEPLVTSLVDGADRGTANRLAVEYMQTTFGIWR